MVENGERISVKNSLHKHAVYLDVVRSHGFSDVEIIVDEWGASSHGFFNREEAPDLMFRETEVFSAYYAKLIYGMIELDPNVSKMMICLSGQHGMTDYFSGYRNFFTMNYIAKPIYAAFVLASKLGKRLLGTECDNPNIYTIATKTSDDGYAVLMAYCNDYLTEELPETVEKVEVLSLKLILENSLY